MCHGPRLLCLPLLTLVALLWGCTGREGMFCQQDGDCRAGLICALPVLDGGTDMGIYGICEPARRGLGEICLRTSECTPELRCSNEWGQFIPDRRHGTCQRQVDAGTGSPDLANLADLAPADAGTQDAAPIADAGADMDRD